MIWNAVLKGGALITFVQGVMGVVEKVFSEEILPHRIYSSVEAAEFLKVDRLAILELIRTGRIKATKADGNYRILGSSILEYMSK